MKQIFLLLLEVALGLAQQLSLIGKPASQGQTIGNHEANLAIDGNSATYALSQSPSVSQNMAWWNVNMGVDYLVQSVSVTNAYSFEGGNDYNLQNFGIYVVSPTSNYVLCQAYTGSPFYYGETKSFTCNNGPTLGRSIYIKKLNGPRTELALAEVQVNVAGNIPTKVPTSDDGMGQEIPVRGFSTTQIGTWGSQFSNFAIDGDIRTYSVACSPCTGPPINNGWWRIDLASSYVITGVQLISSPAYPDTNYLQEIEVRISDQDSSYPSTHCSEFNNRGVEITPNQKLNLRCNIPVRGRYITIIRKPSAMIRPDAVAIGEFKVFGTANGNPGNVPLSNSRNVGAGVASQSRDFALFSANLALDGNMMTYSVAIKNDNNAFAWWQVDMGSPMRFAEIVLYSSPDYANSQCLQSVSIDVSNFNYNDDPSFSRAINCNRSSSTALITPSSELKFKCSTPVVGRYVTVRRINDNTYRSDMLSIAEAKVDGLKV